MEQILRPKKTLSRPNKKNSTEEKQYKGMKDLTSEYDSSSNLMLIPIVCHLKTQTIES